MKLVLSLLVVANLLLFGWFRGWMSPFGGDGREPDRVWRQVAPQQVKVLPPAPLEVAPPVAPAPAEPATAPAPGNSP